MPLNLLSSARYDMPASFGPSIVPDRTEIAHAEALVLSGPTSREAAQALIPGYFLLPEQPVLTIGHMQYHGVDYLGGRSYKEVAVTITASQPRAGQAAIDAALALVLWVDQPGALVAGREFMGLPKILGLVSGLEGSDQAPSFTCGEYDQTLIAGSAVDMNPLDAERLARLNQRADEVCTFGWKYIAAPGGGSDLDYPLINIMRWSYRKAWTGSGEFRFMSPDFADAPMSAAAVAALAALPLSGPVRAFRGIGKAVIDRTATRRLAST